MDENSSNKELPPSINQLVRELGNAKRQELIKIKSPSKNFTNCSLGDFLLMGKNWTEGEDFNLFLGSNRHGEDWDTISKKIPNRTAEQCKIRWEFLNAPPLVKKSILETPKKRENTIQKSNIAQASSLTESKTVESLDVKPQAPSNDVPTLPLDNPNPTPLDYISNEVGPVFIGKADPKPIINQDSTFNFFQETPNNTVNNFEIPTPISLSVPEPKKIKLQDYLPQATYLPSNFDQTGLPNIPDLNNTEPVSKEKALERVIASYTTGKNEARESILAIANLLEQNPQLVPAIRLLESLVSQRPEVPASSFFSAPEDNTPSINSNKRSFTQNFRDSEDGFAFIIPHDKKNLNQVSNEENNGLNMEDNPNENLMYRFATQDLPEELEDDGDFIHTENGPELEYDEKLHVTKRELQSLFEDLEEVTKEASTCKIRKPVKDEDQKEVTLFSLNILNRIRVQQQQNLQLVLQAYAIEVRFRGVESEKAQYWKSRAVHIKRLSDYGQLQTNILNPKIQGSQAEDFLSFFTVPGADYMDAMLETLTNPPETYNPINVSKSMSKSRLTAAAITRRDWIELYPESEFCVPNSPRNVVDKARAITILINEVFSPIFTRPLQPFFTAAKKRDRPIFTPGEDKLFTIGLYKFGDDWPSIRSHVLPARASRQLENRFNNLKSRRAEFNPVQQYYLRQIKPLDLKEEDLLSQGIQIYGRKFRLISQRMMPNRPSFVLKKAWREMELRKIVLSRPMFLDQYS